MFRAILALLLMAAFAVCQDLPAQRFRENPLISLASSQSLGDNINGPSLIRVPPWIGHPLGRYYLYFAHHKGDHIRLAYADSLHGPWKIYEPGVLNVDRTIFFRPQPDPPQNSAFYTHVASPEVSIDEQRKRLILYVHGMWTDGNRWPDDSAASVKWAQSQGYAQFTQTTISRDGIHFEPLPGITLKTSYLRAFDWNGAHYGMARLGVLARATRADGPFEMGPNPFAGSSYAGRVRHVGLVVKQDTLYVFFSGIGDSPERILLSQIALTPDWRNWKASAPVEVLAPKEAYECIDLPAVPSRIGESEGRERALRDPALLAESGKVYLFYSVCGEQGIGAADVTGLIK